MDEDNFRHAASGERLRDDVGLAPAAFAYVGERFLVQKHDAARPVEPGGNVGVEQRDEVGEERLERFLELLVLWHERDYSRVGPA